MANKKIYVVVEGGLVSVYADKGGVDIDCEVLDMDNYDLDEEEEQERDEMYDKLNVNDYDVLY